MYVTYGLIFLATAAIGLPSYFAYRYIVRSAGYDKKPFDSRFFERVGRHDKAERVLGALIVVFGATACFSCVFFTLREALNRASSIFVERGGVAISLIFVWVGMIKLCTGKNSHKYLVSRHGQQMTQLQQTFCTIGVFICLALAFGYEYIFRLLGYREGY